MTKFRALAPVLSISFFFALAPLVSAQTPNKVAIVIGMSGYDDHVGRLPKAETDAKAVSAALDAIGFRVTTLLDSAHTEFQAGITRFANSISRGDVVVVYYAGHGVQVDGVNYLLPADYSGNASDLTKSGVNLDDVVRRIGARAPRLKIFVIDACRDNPFDKNLKTGLANMNAVAYGTGTYIAMAASPGQLATDGLFAKYFVAMLKVPGLEVHEVFTGVRKGVGTESGDREVPFSADLLSESFILSPTNGKAPAEKVRALGATSARGVALSPDGKFAALTTDDGTIRLVNLQTGASAEPLTGADRTPLDIHFSADSNRLVASGEKMLWIWETGSRKSSKLQDKGLGTVLSSSFSSDGKLVATSSSDKKIRIWNTVDGTVADSVPFQNRITWIGFSPDSGFVVALWNDGKHSGALLWKTNSKMLPTALPDSSDLTCVSVAPDGRRLVGGTQDGTIKSWDLTDLQRPQTDRVFLGHTEAVESILFSPDGGRIISAGADRTFRWWVWDGARQLRSLDAPPTTEKILALSFMDDGRVLTAVARSSGIEVWHIPRP